MVKFFQDETSDEHLIYDIRTSCLGALSEVLSDMKTKALISQDAIVLPIEAHADVDEIPPKDLLLFNNFSCITDEKFLRVYFSVGVSIYQDTNAFTHYEAMSYLFSRFKPMTVFRIFSPTLEEIGQATVADSLFLQSMESADTRKVQMMNVECVTTLTLDE